MKALRITLVAVLALMLGVPAMGARSDSTPKADPFESYQALLDKYLSVVSSPGEPMVTRFDYLTLWRNPERKQLCQNIRNELLATTPSKMSARDRHAWGINLYNFLVIETIADKVVTDRVPITAKKMGVKGYQLDTVHQIQFEGQSMFGWPLIEIEGTKYTLDQIERTFVFDGFDHNAGKPAPKNLDVRAHFALVCGAVSCPPLQPRAYRGDSLERQLEEAVRGALRSPALLKVEDDGRVRATQLFQWYAVDFGGPKKTKEFIVKYAPAELKSKLQARDPVPDLYLPWDWNLNQPPKPTLPLVPPSRGDTRSG
jgi:hypothetical protein